MAITLDGTTGITTPGVVNTAAETIATTLAVTGAVTLSSTLKTATTIGVGAATPSASGAGITFPASQSASTDAQTLDDYEEGVWTPSLGGNTTYNFRFGKYTKVGRNVTIEFGFQVNSFGTGSATEVFGLPFSVFTTDGSESYAFPVAYLANSAISVTFATGYSGGGTSLIFGSTNAAVATFGLNSAIFQASTRVHVCGTYFTTT